MHHGFKNADEWAKVFDDPARDAWQQPDRIVAELGLTAAMTVADIGAGTGYFTVRIARAVPNGQVIATDHPAAIHDNLQVQQAYLGTHAKDKTDA